VRGRGGKGGKRGKRTLHITGGEGHPRDIGSNHDHRKLKGIHPQMQRRTERNGKTKMTKEMKIAHDLPR